MKRLAILLTDYVICKGLANEETRDIYEYGFQFAAETILSIIISVLIAIPMHMMMEAVLFFFIFIPIRSYAGGLHLERYINCLALSSIVLFIVLLAVKELEMPIGISLILSLVLLIGIRMLYPVEHVNRPIDEEEKAYFKRKLNIFMAIDCFLVILFFIVKLPDYLFLTTITLAMIAVTMILGKVKYKITMEHMKKNACE